MIVFWAGPVQASTLQLAKWQGTPPRVLTVNAGVDGAIGSSAFGALAAQLAAKSGTTLRGLLAAAKIDPATTEPIALAGFSAAHGLIEPILANPKDAARIVAVGAFDAYYTDAAKTPKPGYLAYAKRAVARETRMVLTSSKVPDGSLPSGEQCAAALVASLPLSPIPLVNVGKAVCASARGAGSFRWLVYADRTDVPGAGGNLRASHAQHATILAPALMPGLVAGVADARSSSSSGSALAAFVGMLFLVEALS